MNATVTIIRRLRERRELNRWLREQRRHRYQRLPVSAWIEQDINPHGPTHPIRGGSGKKANQRGLLHWPVLILHREVAS